MSTPEDAVLIVDDDPAVAMVLRAGLADQGIAAESAGSAEEAISVLERRPFGAILSDVRMSGLSGMELLSVLHRRWPDTPVILVTAHGNVRMAVEAMKVGATDFLTKPFDLEEVVALIRRALAVSARQRDQLAQIPTSPAGLASRSPAMLATQAILRRVASSDATVLLLGESGVGKEVAAHLVHDRSARAGRPFIAVHCAALPDALLESELFGYERGAFSGAASRKPGRLELAEGGTLFLDEIGETSLATQVKLLRVLQERTFERLGGVTTIRANVRFIAATHADLPAMMARGTFREDLYYRLSVCPVHLPSLRERPEDIIPLVEHFARIHGAGRFPVAFEQAALQLLAAQPWPGNVRELQNLVERMVLLSDGPWIGVAAVSDELERNPGRIGAIAAASPPAVADGRLDSTRRDAEREALRKALERSGGNRAQAARLLGVSRRTLYYKLAEYSLE